MAFRTRRDARTAPPPAATSRALLLPLLAIPLAACGGAPPPPAEQPAEEQAPVEDSGPPELGWGAWWEQGDSACPPGGVIRQMQKLVACVQLSGPGGRPVPTGPGTGFHDSGSKAAEGSFAQGQQHGVWVYWDEGGGVLKRERYDHGVLHDLEYIGAEQSYEEAMRLLCNSVSLSGAARVRDPDAAFAINAGWLKEHIENPEAGDLLSSLGADDASTVQARLQQAVSAAGITRCPLLTPDSGP
ncbi:toxin-antitoxin system YwqK family antitoxin [Haliangium ochraceum]|uniref:MORN variant repeat protein n=1 Tax=Haliangium ochraceum (strain DSM 14365 / JCM 11303 / SMP-2) TaxID=502025 RepID=D0LTX7_HALO1|nr:hypothetical protein [Haliangium ochraceum]ACY15821.1 hypothetical protein Hoch_3319 [Haliangium ochraceum DSM 14365]